MVDGSMKATIIVTQPRSIQIWQLPLETYTEEAKKKSNSKLKQSKEQKIKLLQMKKKGNKQQRLLQPKRKAKERKIKKMMKRRKRKKSHPFLRLKNLTCSILTNLDKLCQRKFPDLSYLVQ